LDGDASEWDPIDGGDPAPKDRDALRRKGRCLRERLEVDREGLTGDPYLDGSWTDVEALRPGREGRGHREIELELPRFRGHS
jgi:hypothetical protein